MACVVRSGWTKKMIDERIEKKKKALRFSRRQCMYVIFSQYNKHTSRDMLAAVATQYTIADVILTLQRSHGSQSSSSSSATTSTSVYKCSILRSGSSVNG